MGNRAYKVCKVNGCSELTTEVYCSKHKHIGEELKKARNKYYDARLRNKESAKFYKSKAWIRTRQLALLRDRYLCQDCLKANRISFAEVVHHIIPITENKSLELNLDNLTSLCNVCHNIRHKTIEK